MRTFLEGVGGIIVIGVLVVAVTAFSLAMLGFFGPQFRDVNREITQHSQAYIETKTQLLLGLIGDYESPDATEGQKKATINEYCYQATLLLEEEKPTTIVRFEAEHC